MSFNAIVGGTKQGLGNTQDFLDGKSQALVQPNSTEGVSGWVFDIPDTHNIEQSSEITDHVVENNGFISDHIIEKPTVITLSGFIGELVYRPPAGLFGINKTIKNRLLIVEEFGGEFVSGATQQIEQALAYQDVVVDKLNEALGKANNIVDFFSGQDQTSDKQSKAYNDLNSLRLSKERLTVRTPWEFFENMFITGISFTQDAESAYITNISITLKEVRFADTEFTDFEENLFPPREEMQKQAEEAKGEAKGVKKSFLLQAKEKIL
jgi:hypothetical protein